tara:strand:- start:174 stop:533 length:360 start_codon:yes stop_codon:yes gene_type:complete
MFSLWLSANRMRHILQPAPTISKGNHMTILEQMQLDAHKCNLRAQAVWGKGFKYIPDPNAEKPIHPNKIDITSDIKKNIILWYISGKSRARGLKELDVKEHIYRKIVNDFKNGYYDNQL